MENKADDDHVNPRNPQWCYCDDIISDWCDKELLTLLKSHKNLDEIEAKISETFLDDIYLQNIKGEKPKDKKLTERQLPKKLKWSWIKEKQEKMQKLETKEGQNQRVTRINQNYKYERLNQEVAND
jgi:hypothetical protein